MNNVSKNSIPFPSEMFDALSRVEAHHWWFRARNHLLLWVLKKKIPPFENFLEIGCGTGYVLEGIREAFPNADLSGSEYFEEGLKHARKRVPSANFIQLDATLMEDEARYDIIGAFDVIEHIEDDVKVLENLALALRRGGHLLITVPQHRWLWSEADEHACHVRRYTKSELIRKAENAGLRTIYSTSFVSLLIPLMVLSRLRSKKENYDPMKEFHIPNWLNVALEAIMSLEFGLLRIGIRLSFGGSLLMLAKKQ